jgi:hypothetical protein
MIATLGKTPTQVERELQMEEGRRRHRADGYGNIRMINETPCTALIDGEKVDGTIVGAIFSMDKSVMRAYHIVDLDGKRYTISSNDVKISQATNRIGRVKVGQ